MKPEDVKLVIIESPYAGDVERNVEYAQLCMRDCFDRGEAPFASHLLYPQALDDNNKLQRRQGIEAGLIWGEHADITAVYIDHGLSEGMRTGITRAVLAKRPVEYRRLGEKDERKKEEA